ncbi:MAG: hypothetical protein K9N09_12195 [Candidatus Cloacimonetes bacterium]|nr:hypothetical protein [Candidatus Cloacimonadota bacterium]MCF7869444.1 hypothetical protein [Candidatus Cloacimonadota bacterium]
MRKLLLMLILIFIIFELSSINEFACIYTLINTSAKGVAFGNKSGAADIWDTSPLGVWSNPAKLGYHKGLAYGYSDTPWLKNVFSDIYIKSKYVSIGWNGLGILLPISNDRDRLGTFMSYGEQTQTDSLGNVIGTFESWDADTKFAIGMNSLEFVFNLLKSDLLNKINKFGELSFGYSYDDLYSKLGPMGTGSFEPMEYSIGESSFSSYGFIGRISPFNETNALGGFCTLDVVGSINNINPAKSKITYINVSQADYLPWGIRTAVSGKIVISKKLIPDFKIHPIIDFFSTNLISFYYSYDDQQIGKESPDNPGEWGKGYEIIFFDLFSLRKGYYSDITGEVKGDTSGYGFNLRFNDIIQFQYNYAEFPGGDLQEKQSIDDYLVRVDFMKLLRLIKHH